MSNLTGTLSNVGFIEQPATFTLTRKNDHFVVTISGTDYDVVLVQGHSGDSTFKPFGFVEGLPFCVPRPTKAAKPATKVSSDNVLSLSMSHNGSTVSPDGHISIGDASVDLSVFHDVVVGRNLPFQIQKDDNFAQARLTLNANTLKSRAKELYSMAQNDTPLLCKSKPEISSYLQPIIHQMKVDPASTNSFILGGTPFLKLLPVVGFRDGLMRSSSTAKIISFLMICKKLLDKNDLTIFSKKINVFPHMEFTDNADTLCDVYYHPTSQDKTVDIGANVFKILENSTQKVIVRCNFSPNFNWEDVYEKFPTTIFFRCGSLLSSTFGVFYDPKSTISAPNPKNYFAKQYAYEFSYASYILKKTLFEKPVGAPKISVKMFAGPTTSANTPLELDSFVLNKQLPCKYIEEDIENIFEDPETILDEDVFLEDEQPKEQKQSEKDEATDNVVFDEC